MKQNNLNIPAIVVKRVNGVEKQISGKLVSVNESMNTCNMLIHGKEYKNIPLKNILINEGFIDKIKEAGKKVYDFVKRTVKGFFVLVDEATGKFLQWSTLTMANTARMAAKGQLPAGIKFAPSVTMANAAGVGGMSIDEAFAESMNNDRMMIEAYWRRVIKRAGTSDETLEESVKFVNENYYKINPAYKALNEAAIYSLDDIKSEEGYGGYGTVINAKQLKNKLIQNIRNQISGQPGKHADEPAMLIWGAPGIGKTAIINSTIKEMANRKRNAVNLSLLTIMLAGYTIENWTLPSITPKSLDVTDRFTDCPKTWLPVYLKTSDPNEEARRDEYCNTGEYRNAKFSADGRIHEGGVVFMDEYSRTLPNVQNIIMGLINEHKFGDDYVVASKWGFVFAANRSYDDGVNDSDDLRYYPVAAQNNRFVQYTYVPRKEDWLEWATSIDPITHKANVPPFITEFIAQANEHVWYSTITNGGYDDMLGKIYGGDTKQINSVKNNKFDSYDAASDYETLKKTKRLVTPRTWANFIGPAYEKQLINLLEGNSKGISGEEMYQELLNKSVQIKTDKDGTTYKEYYGGILPNLLINALNDIDNDYWDEEYEIMGGDEILDPAHTLTGKTGRYSKLMVWLRNEIAERIGDGEKASPLIKDWDDYNSYAKYMTDDVLESIWETGHVPAQYEDDDDYMPANGVAGYNNTEFAKWKANTLYQKDIINNKLLQAYPGNIYEDMAKDVETLQSSALPTPEEAEQILNDAAQRTTYTINKNGKPKQESIFFNLGKDIPKSKALEAMRYAKVIRDSVVCQKLMNMLTWVAKIAQQCNRNDISNDVNEYIKNNILAEAPDQELVDNFLNRPDMIKLRAELTKKGIDPDTDKSMRSAQALSGISPILHMLETIKNRRFAQVRDAKNQ